MNALDRKRCEALAFMARNDIRRIDGEAAWSAYKRECRRVVGLPQDPPVYAIPTERLTETKHARS